ncbi:hypothetical protein [Yersinia rochesterensis]|uniref:hypothetical protein n=1 Tax=Yersinia rochesterensis TaxID=1604335 RepID=UPI0034DCCDE2
MTNATNNYTGSTSVNGGILALVSVVALLSAPIIKLPAPVNCATKVLSALTAPCDVRVKLSPASKFS